MKDEDIIKLYFERSERAIKETQLKIWQALYLCNKKIF